MLVLLPPSEGKTRPGARRPPVDLHALSWPELSEARERVLRDLAAASARPDALALLGVGASLAGEVGANGALRTAPAAPVSQLYSGVLYDALGWSTLSPAGRRRGGRWLVVVSALWGSLRPSDKVPTYRLSMNVRLPSLGPLAAYWRPLLDLPLALAAGAGLVVDCRSTTYQAAWSPSGAVAGRTVEVRVLREEAGRRVVVSHLAKHTRGLVARHLLERGGAEPRTVPALVRAVSEVFHCELTGGSPGRPSRLDVVVRD